MKRLFVGIVAVSASIACADAALIGGNDLNFAAGNDGYNLTIDTDTGLEWLDLTETGSSIFDDTPSAITSEFRRATVAEVLELFAHAGLVNPLTGLPISEITINVDGAPPASLGLTDAQFIDLFTAADTLIGMLGVTAGNNYDVLGSFGTTSDTNTTMPANNEVAGLRITYSPFVTLPPGGCLNKLGEPGCFARSLEIDVPIAGNGQSDAGGSGGVSHFFVRGSTPPVTVPEPAGLALLGLALLGLAGRRARA